MLIEMKGVSITSKPRKDGRYQGYVMQGDEKTYVYGRTRDEVAAKIKVLIREPPQKKKKREKKSPAPTLNEWLDKWLELYKKPNLKPLSILSLTSLLKVVRSAFGDREIDKITTNEIQSFFLSMKATSTRDQLKRYLAQAFEKAKQLELIKFNPCSNLEIKKSKIKKRRALTHDEQKKFLKEIEDTKYFPLAVFLLQTGLRIGEALALTVADIDIDKKMVVVNKNVVFVGGKKMVQNSPKSAAGNRTVPIPPFAFSLLPALEDPKQILFPLGASRTISDFFERISQKLEFSVTPHVLRHTYATRLEEMGVSAKMAQYLLGHASIQTTKDIYTDVQSTYVEETAKKIFASFDTKI